MFSCLEYRACWHFFVALLLDDNRAISLILEDRVFTKIALLRFLTLNLTHLYEKSPACLHHQLRNHRLLLALLSHSLTSYYLLHFALLNPTLALVITCRAFTHLLKWSEDLLLSVVCFWASHLLRRHDEIEWSLHFRGFCLGIYGFGRHIERHRRRMSLVRRVEDNLPVLSGRSCYLCCGPS